MDEKKKEKEREGEIKPEKPHKVYCYLKFEWLIIYRSSYNDKKIIHFDI